MPSWRFEKGMDPVTNQSSVAVTVAVVVVAAEIELKYVCHIEVRQRASAVCMPVVVCYGADSSGVLLSGSQRCHGKL